MIKIVGDINLTNCFFNVGFGIGTNIAKGLDPLKFLRKPNEDIWVGNFEGVASSVSVNNGIYAKAFRIDPKALDRLCHMDYYGLANNHSMEHGAEAFWETVSSLESYGCKVFGTLKQKSIIFEYNNREISITGLSTRIESTKHKPQYWHNPEYIEIKNELTSLPATAFKILFVHWGNEYINRPSIAQRKFAHWLLDSGFDLIIGMHPHVLQGFEDYNGKRVYYSLGNCVFDMPSLQCKIGAVVGLDFYEDRAIYSEKYLKIDDDCCPRVIPESEVPPQWRFNYLNERLKIEDNSEEYHKEMRTGYLVYRNANRKRLLATAVYHPASFYGVFMDFVRRNFMK